MKKEDRVSVDVKLPEIYKLLCDDCKGALEKLVRDKLNTQLAKRMLEEGE